MGDDKGKPVREGGDHLVIKTPWPAMFSTLYHDPERYVDAYWSKFPGMYLSGDVALDEEGYFWIQGREDDVLNVAGHRIRTAKVESAMVSYDSVAEAAVVGKPDPVKGEEICSFIILKEDFKPSPRMKHHLRNMFAGKLARWPVRPVLTSLKIPPKPVLGRSCAG